MPTCPKCKEDIDHLHAFVKETVKYEIWPESKLYPDKPDPGLNWGRPEPVEGSEVLTEFCCPECGKAIFEDRSRVPPCPVCGAKDSRLVEELGTLYIEELVEKFLEGKLYPCDSLCIHHIDKECEGTEGPLCVRPDNYKEIGDVTDNLMNQRDEDA
uniref:Uncharacterized protein n=1 Tax=viral metagenome TaxID=1070528 RepID=A0A6M3LXG9_9ZZZZ